MKLRKKNNTYTSTFKEDSKWFRYRLSIHHPLDRAPPQPATFQWQIKGFMLGFPSHKMYCNNLGGDCYQYWVPWEPTTFIFKGLFHPYFEGSKLKTFIFPLGFGVQGWGGCKFVTSTCVLIRDSPVD